MSEKSVAELEADLARDRAWFEGRLRTLAEAHGYTWVRGLDLETIAVRLRARLTNLEVALEVAARRCHVAFHEGEEDWRKCRTQACEEAKEVLNRSGRPWEWTEGSAKP